MKQKLTNLLYCFSFALIVLAAVPTFAQGGTKTTVLVAQHNKYIKKNLQKNK